MPSQGRFPDSFGATKNNGVRQPARPMPFDQLRGELIGCTDEARRGIPLPAGTAQLVQIGRALPSCFLHNRES